MGWTFPWVSSGDSTFNYDFHVTHDPNVQTEYNYKPFEWRDLEAKKKGDDEDMPGTSVFFRDGEKVFHTYSSYARGGEQLITTYAYLDITPLGRQEKGTGIEEFKYHDEY